MGSTPTSGTSLSFSNPGRERSLLVTAEPFRAEPHHGEAQLRGKPGSLATTVHASLPYPVTTLSIHLFRLWACH